MGKDMKIIQEIERKSPVVAGQGRELPIFK
jgi:hypothetical protein